MAFDYGDHVALSHPHEILLLIDILLYIWAFSLGESIGAFDLSVLKGKFAHITTMINMTILLGLQQQRGFFNMEVHVHEVGVDEPPDDFLVLREQDGNGLINDI